jgi:hypothetical protein
VDCDMGWLRARVRCAFFDRNLHLRMPLAPRLLA